MSSLLQRVAAGTMVNLEVTKLDRIAIGVGQNSFPNILNRRRRPVGFYRIRYR
jgi:hypothetical protein